MDDINRFLHLILVHCDTAKLDLPRLNRKY